MLTQGLIFPDDKICLSEECVLAASNLIKMIDKSVDPCENFYAYSCGKYIKEEPIPMFQVAYSLV